MDDTSAPSVPADISATDAVSLSPLHSEIHKQFIDDAATREDSSASTTAAHAQYGQGAEERGVEQAPVAATHRANAERQPAQASIQDPEDARGEHRAQPQAEHVSSIPEQNVHCGRIRDDTCAVNSDTDVVRNGAEIARMEPLPCARSTDGVTGPKANNSAPVKTDVDEARQAAKTDCVEPLRSKRDDESNSLASAKVKHIREELDALHATLLQKASALSDGLPLVTESSCGSASLQRAPSFVPSVTELSLEQARNILNGPSVSDVKSKSSSSRRTRTSRSRTYAAPCALPAERLTSAISILMRMR